MESPAGMAPFLVTRFGEGRREFLEKHPDQNQLSVVIPEGHVPVFLRHFEDPIGLFLSLRV